LPEHSIRFLNIFAIRRKFVSFGGFIFTQKWMRAKHLKQKEVYKQDICQKDVSVLPLNPFMNQKYRRLKMHIFLGEVIGTMFLILLGDGVVANVLLGKTKGNNSGWIVITTAWAMAVFVGVFTSLGVGGNAHLNPAVTIGLAVSGAVSWGEVPVYFAGEFIGAFLGAILVWLAYLPHWAETQDQGLKLAVFSTGPAIRNTTANLICEIIGTFALMLGVFLIKGAQMITETGATANINLGAISALPVALLVWVIGLALGGPTGYAINPARDLGPRIMHAILPIAGKGESDWGYSWIPVVGPIVGAIIAAFIFLALPK
jgi:glycerol uptake facilitator protein